ncbi:hypothetical protein DFQ26_000939, partial [Actinomortierella ambigua]
PMCSRSYGSEVGFSSRTKSASDLRPSSAKTFSARSARPSDGICRISSDTTCRPIGSPDIWSCNAMGRRRS